MSLIKKISLFSILIRSHCGWKSCNLSSTMKSPLYWPTSDWLLPHIGQMWETTESDIAQCLVSIIREEICQCQWASNLLTTQYVSESDILGPIDYYSNIENLVSLERALFEDYSFKYRTKIFLLFMLILPLWSKCLEHHERCTWHI